jgi:hypothetical protein
MKCGELKPCNAAVAAAARDSMARVLAEVEKGGFTTGAVDIAIGYAWAAEDFIRSRVSEWPIVPSPRLLLIEGGRP